MKAIFATLASTILLAACAGSEGDEAPDAAASGETAAAGDEMSAPVGDPPASAASSAAPAPSADRAPRARQVSVRGPGGLEERCLARVDSETDGSGVSTNRIEESEAAIAIYVNVPGAEAPWRCLAYRDGTIGEIMYTGSEGAM